MFHTPKQTPELQYALAVILSIAPTVFTALRFRVRIAKRIRIGWDDWLILFALVSVYITAVFLCIGTALGYQGRHMRFTADRTPILSDPGYRWFLKMLYAGQLSQIFAIGPTKISVLLFYRRIFRGFWFHFASWTVLGFVLAWMISFFFANMLECLPIPEAFLNAPGMGGNPNCIDAIPMYLAQVYSDVILDVLILIIPIPLVWKLHLPTKQKLGVLGLFLLGIITVLASCAKMIIFNYVGHELQQQGDISYFLSPVVYWPLIEASLQIIAACLTMLRPLIEDWRIIYSSVPPGRREGYSRRIGREASSAKRLKAMKDDGILKSIDVVQEFEPHAERKKMPARDHLHMIA